ncbi:hypothetical protein ABZP36_019067 [Zizania latifolia]
MAWDESFKRPGSIPFKWELQPGVPKQSYSHHHGGGATTGSGASPAPASTLLLPPRLGLPPAAAASSPGSDTGAKSLASTPSPNSSSSSRRRSMSARFTASTLMLPFTRPRRGRSKDEDDIAFSVIYGDKIL